MQDGDTKATTSTESRSLANQTPTGAPEQYQAFTAPEGFTIDEETVKQIGPIFKRMNLSQADAQELVDLYSSRSLEAINAPYQAWREMQERWVKDIKADPTIGPRLTEVTSTISKAIDGVGDPKLAQEFRDAMDYTGAGNNPAFLKMLFKISQKLTEGGFVRGNGPSPHGQQPDRAPRTGARAMYPNLS